jgi:prepilin-type N-terminal cleavage/methylation domain-containing protein
MCPFFAQWSHRLKAPFAARTDMARAGGGFTLIELLVSVAVLGVLTALALPSFSSLIQRKQIEAFNNEFRASVNYAKQQAQRTGVRTVICARNAGENTCATKVGSAKVGDTEVTTGWEAGWLVFHDVAPSFAASVETDNNNVFNADEGETLLKVKDSVTTFTAGTIGPEGRTLNPFFAFSGGGFVADATPFCVKSCAVASCEKNDNNRYLIVTATGHVRIEEEKNIALPANKGFCS